MGGTASIDYVNVTQAIPAEISVSQVVLIVISNNNNPSILVFGSPGKYRLLTKMCRRISDIDSIVESLVTESQIPSSHMTFVNQFIESKTAFVFMRLNENVLDKYQTQTDAFCVITVGKHKYRGTCMTNNINEESVVLISRVREKVEGFPVSHCTFSNVPTVHKRFVPMTYKAYDVYVGLTKRDVTWCMTAIVENDCLSLPITERMSTDSVTNVAPHNTMPHGFDGKFLVTLQYQIRTNPSKTGDPKVTNIYHIHLYTDAVITPPNWCVVSLKRERVYGQKNSAYFKNDTIISITHVCRSYYHKYLLDIENKIAYDRELIDNQHKILRNIENNWYFPTLIPTFI